MKPSNELTRLRAYLVSRFSASVREVSTVDVAIALLEHLWRIEQMQVVALRTRYVIEQAEVGTRIQDCSGLAVLAD